MSDWLDWSPVERLAYFRRRHRDLRLRCRQARQRCPTLTDYLSAFCVRIDGRTDQEAYVADRERAMSDAWRRSFGTEPPDMATMERVLRHAETLP